MARKYAPNRIYKLRMERGWTRDQLISKMDTPVSISTIQKLEESAMGLTLDYMIMVAQGLGVSPGELIDAHYNDADGRAYPLIGKVPAGPWKEAVSDPQGTVYAPRVGGPQCFALRPEGDSMNKLIPEDAPSPVIVVDPEQKDLVSGKVYVVQNSEKEATYKRFFSDPARFEPCSTNPDHQPIILGRESFTVIGRVVYAGMEL